jgi:cytochrome c oxidase cbb3-type subunit II
MKNGPLFLLGLFSALVISFGGIVLGSHAQLGGLTPYFDDTEGQSFPLRNAGIAMRGQQVYTELGCAACHTQQVRRPDFGSDQARGWGERQSVARDYIFQARPQLGASRLGPDLTNYGARKVKAPAERPAAESELYRLLYEGSGSHPAYKFLFEERTVTGEASPLALKVTGTALPAGVELVPTEQARTLVTYLLSLNNTYDYPEARPVAPTKKVETLPPHGQEKPIPAAAPDEKKKQTEQKK